MCPCDLLTVLARGTVTSAKADTVCYSSPVFHSVPHSGSECSAPFSFSQLFTSSAPPPPPSTATFSALSNWPQLCHCCAAKPTAPGFVGLACVQMACMCVSVCVCGRGGSCLSTLIKNHACKLQRETKAHLCQLWVGKCFPLSLWARWKSICGIWKGGGSFWVQRSYPQGTQRDKKVKVKSHAR